ncbi:MAG: GNAT family protein [Alphaproteobacteria bacterium]
MNEYKLKNGKTVIIRAVEESDYEMVQDYVAKMAEETIFTNQYVGQPRKEKDAFIKAIKNVWLQVVVDKDMIVGLISAGICKPNHPWLKYTGSFGIHMLNVYQGQGLGTKLMNMLDDWAKDNRLHRIEGSVRTQNVSAISLYLKCGYKIEGEVKDYALINNEWHNEYLIAKILR